MGCGSLVHPCLVTKGKSRVFYSEFESQQVFSSHIFFILATYIFLCSHKGLFTLVFISLFFGALFLVLIQTQYQDMIPEKRVTYSQTGFRTAPPTHPPPQEHGSKINWSTHYVWYLSSFPYTVLPALKFLKSKCRRNVNDLKKPVSWESELLMRKIKKLQNKSFLV